MLSPLQQRAADLGDLLFAVGELTRTELATVLEGIPDGRRQLAIHHTIISNYITQSRRR